MKIPDKTSFENRVFANDRHLGRKYAIFERVIYFAVNKADVPFLPFLRLKNITRGLPLSIIRLSISYQWAWRSRFVAQPSRPKRSAIKLLSHGIRGSI